MASPDVDVPNNDSSSDDHPRGADFFYLRILLYWLGGFMALTIVAIIMFGTGCVPFASMVIWAIGIAAVGAIVGFIFGIPRVLTETRTATNAITAPADAALSIPVLSAPGERYRLTANTNLEQVSDWLTKIIVGVGLVELTKIPGAISKLAGAMAPSFGTTSQAESVATGVILVFGAGGFLVGYVTTRAFLPQLFRDAEREEFSLAVRRLRAMNEIQTLSHASEKEAKKARQ